MKMGEEAVQENMDLGKKFYYISKMIEDCLGLHLIGK